MKRFMNLRTKYVLTLAFNLLLCLSLFGQHQDAGTTGFSTLKLVYSARANGMGQAMTGRTANFDAMQFNPATLLKADNKAVCTTLMDHFVGSAGGSISYIIPKDIYTAYGFFVNYWNSGSIDRTEIGSNGELIELDDTFGAQNVLAGFSLARFLSPAVDVGGSVKLILDQIDGNSASAAMVDIGFLHHTANDNIKVGLTARNIGFQISHYNDTKYGEGLPTTYMVGAGIDLTKNTLLDIDITKATGENFTGKLGVEHKIHPALVLRGGFRSNAGDYAMGGSLGWTSGVSLGLGWVYRTYAIDYALSSYGDLGLTNQLSLRYNFGN